MNAMKLLKNVLPLECFILYDSQCCHLETFFENLAKMIIVLEFAKEYDTVNANF